MIVANNDDPPAIFMNRLTSCGNYLRVTLIGPSGKNQDAVGARVRTLVPLGGQERKLTRWVEVGSGYCSQSDMRLHFGLGPADRIQRIDVDWPDGTTEEFTGQKIVGIRNCEIRIKQGTGQIERMSETGANEIATRSLDKSLDARRFEASQ
jgi:hypothetical protein